MWRLTSFEDQPPPLAACVTQSRWRTLKRIYCRMLRDADTRGWHRAKSDYLRRERGFGRPLSDIMSELDLFEHLNRMALEQHIDPIAAQRRRDLYERVLRPAVLVAGAVVVFYAARLGVSGFAAVSLGASSCWVALAVTRATLCACQ